MPSREAETHIFDAVRDGSLRLHFEIQPTYHLFRHAPELALKA
jgi:hypothetical protein